MYIPKVVEIFRTNTRSFSSTFSTLDADPRLENKYSSTAYSFTFAAVGNKALLSLAPFVSFPKTSESQMDVVSPPLCHTHFQDIGA